MSTVMHAEKGIPDIKVHGENMGPIWGRQDPGGPHVGPMNFAIWDAHKCVSMRSVTYEAMNNID